MEKKKFELLAFGIWGISFLYVPTKYCQGDICISAEWEFIFSFYSAVVIDIPRLLLQVVFIGIALYGYWRFKYLP